MTDPVRTPALTGRHHAQPYAGPRNIGVALRIPHRGSRFGLGGGPSTAEQQAFAERDLSGVDFVYLWADGIHVNVRLDDQRLCLLVMIGVRADGRKELVALTDGYREAAQSWADLLRDCRRRGMRAPVLGRTGALGFRARFAR